MPDSETPTWMNDPLVQKIPKEKLHLLQEMFAKAGALAKGAGNTRNQKEMLMTMMPLLKEARERHLNFTPEEMQAAIAAIRKYSTPEELNQIDNIYRQTGHK